MGEFTDNINFGNWYQIIASTTSFIEANTYKDLDLAELQEEVRGLSQISIYWDSSNNEFKFNDTGIYVIQTRFTFSGGANDQYTIRYITNEKIIEDSAVAFSTKGANWWEVQNMMIVDFPLWDSDANGWGTSERTFNVQVKNNNDLTSIVCRNASIVIYKIG